MAYQSPHRSKPLRSRDSRIRSSNPNVTPRCQIMMVMIVRRMLNIPAHRPQLHSFSHPMLRTRTRPPHIHASQARRFRPRNIRWRRFSPLIQALFKITPIPLRWPVVPPQTSSASQPCAETLDVSGKCSLAVRPHYGCFSLLSSADVEDAEAEEDGYDGDY